MRAILIRTPTGLVGSTDTDHEAWEKFKRQLAHMKPGKFLRMEWATPRNGRHHRKMMALLQFINQNSDTYDTIPKALVAIKLAAGYFDPHIDPASGEVQRVPHSIKYESMSQEAFNDFYSHALHAVLTCILPQFDQEMAMRMMDQIVSGWITEVPR
jgi:hypothetical protein